MALNNHPCLRRNWSPFNNGLSSVEGLGTCGTSVRTDITPGVSRCCDSKELEINLSYNHFFCGPRPTTGINQIPSFPYSILHTFSFSPLSLLPPSYFYPHPLEKINLIRLCTIVQPAHPFLPKIY